MNALRLATRRSPLALAQAELVRDAFARLHVTCELVALETTGDQRASEPLEVIGGQGVFAVEIQRAVLEGRADVAVHSAKDLPSDTPVGLVLAAAIARADPADVLVGRSLAGLGPGATVATGSPRRRALLLERRPDVHVVDLRGNMATRVAAAGTNGIDAVVTAAAALDRLGWGALIAERLDPAWFVPQVGQGTLALEVRDGDQGSLSRVRVISDDASLRTLRAERAFLQELGAGCSVPVAAYATTDSISLTLSGLMAARDGSVVLRATGTGTDPEEVGRALARTLRDERGGALLWAPTL